jgi:hypothetical protein
MIISSVVTREQGKTCQWERRDPQGSCSPIQRAKERKVEMAFGLGAR